MHIKAKRGFTLIELLVVVGILVILVVAVLYLLNPRLLIQQGQDGNRAAGVGTIDKAISLYYANALNNPKTMYLGSSSVVYVSIPDPTATTAAGTNCAGIGLSVPGILFHCAASSTYRKVDGTGWIPINFTSYPGGSPISTLSTDPVNATSSYQYFTYSTNGTQYEINAVPQSTKDSSSTSDFSKGTNLALIPAKAYSTPPPCNPPTMTSRWAAYNPANTCTNNGASTCNTNGQIAWSVPDFNGVYPAGRLFNANNPVFTTNAVNVTLPSFSFSPVGPDSFDVGIPSSITQYTFYAVINLTTSGNNAIVGPHYRGGLVWMISSAGKSTFGSPYVGGPISGNATYSTGVWYTVGLELDTGSGNYTFFQCSGGTCTTDATGTGATFGLYNPIVYFGGDSTDGYLMNGQIAEIGFLNGISTTGIGAWSSCEYGI